MSGATITRDQLRPVLATLRTAEDAAWTAWTTESNERQREAFEATGEALRTLDLLLNPVRPCAASGCSNVVHKPRTGPMRKTCSDACRQRAHRAGR
ncbi:protein of unknown function [Streptomyces murinus]